MNHRFIKCSSTLRKVTPILVAIGAVRLVETGRYDRGEDFDHPNYINYVHLYGAHNETLGYVFGGKDESELGLLERFYKQWNN